MCILFVCMVCVFLGRGGATCVCVGGGGSIFEGWRRVPVVADLQCVCVCVCVCVLLLLFHW